MKEYTYFDKINDKAILMDMFEDIIHIPSSYDGYSLVKQKGWNILYIEPKDFHQKIDEEVKIFFREFFKNSIYLLDLPLSNKVNYSDIELLKINNYDDFVHLWNYYTVENYTSNQYSEVDNRDFIIEQFFLSSNLGIFDDNLDWIFYNDVDYHLSALLYSDHIASKVEKIFKGYAGIIPLEEIREDIPNFATKKLY